MRLVPVNCVREGSYLGKTILDSCGRALLKKGAKLDNPILKKIEMNGIYSVYIKDEYSENELEDIIKPEIRQKAIKTIKESYENLMKYSKYREGNLLDFRKASKSKYKYIEDIDKISRELLNEVLSKKNVLVNLVDIKTMDNYTYEHSIDVAVLSIIIGMELNFTENRLYKLTIGAILHDIGKIFIPKEVLLKNGRLTETEFSLIKKHPERGFNYIQDEDGIYPTSRIVILQHHERINGTGYPYNLKGNKIHEFSKIVSLADVYDALTSDRPYRLAIPPNEAVEYIMGGVGRYFDLKYVNAFLKRIVPYPEGTLVRMCNGDIGVVEKVNREYPLRPKIKIIWKKGKGKIAEHIDLMEVKNAVIKGVQYKIPNS
ncbi:MAG: HD-GYP domain-containing protein [Clostridiales bacterium]|nr:HD-GYP domain-containing protein [Clostridiales bacterium]